jgi:hypothetical protein
MGLSFFIEIAAYMYAVTQWIIDLPPTTTAYQGSWV